MVYKKGRLYLKIKVLGTAAATSMPLGFCNCDICKRARQNAGKDIRKRSSIIINDDMLIDLGPDSINACNMYGIDTSKIKYLVQTHSHADHFDGGHFVTRWSEYATKNLNYLDIYCSNGTAIDMNHWIKENEPSLDLFKEECKKDLKYELHIMKHGDIAKFNDYEIVAIDSKHDERVESLIYIISYKGKNLLYGTDLLEITEDAWKIIENYKLNIIFLDQTYGEGCNNGGHLDEREIKKIIEYMDEHGITNQKSEIYATHISHEGNNTHEIMEEKAKLSGYCIAYDGMEITI